MGRGVGSLGCRGRVYGAGLEAGSWDFMSWEKQQTSLRPPHQPQVAVEDVYGATVNC